LVWKCGEDRKEARRHISVSDSLGGGAKLCRMDDIFVSRMKERVIRLRHVADLAHDQRIVAVVSKTADEIEEDIKK